MGWHYSHHHAWRWLEAVEETEAGLSTYYPAIALSAPNGVMVLFGWQSCKCGQWRHAALPRQSQGRITTR